jgi:hypothetical protein
VVEVRTRAARGVRAAFAAGRLGLADLVMVSFPASEVLRAHEAGDQTRSRRAFDLHLTLCEPLREWYSVVEKADPGRVVWSFLATGVPAAASVRPMRSDGALLRSPVGEPADSGMRAGRG